MQNQRVRLARLAGLVAAVALIGCPVFAQSPAQTPDPVPLPVHVGGRVIADADAGLSFGWPGVYFEGRFSGVGVRVRFEAPTDHMRLLIDDREVAVFRRPGRVETTFDALPPGEHRIRLEKLTETQAGGGRFLGFFPVGATTPLPAPARSRQIEFIGDSFTVGYGNTSPTRTCSVEEIHARTDTQQAFGPQVARRFEADYRINASSGFGMVRNFNGGSPDLSLPILYPRLKPDAADRTPAPDDAWMPRLIVINLGTNDFSKPLNPGEPWADEAELRAAYRARYAAFIAGLHAARPQARFILMGADAFFGEVEQVAAAVNATTPDLATPLKFDGLDLGGCDWHPSLADDARLAGLVEGAIAKMGDVWGEGRTTPQTLRP